MQFYEEMKFDNVQYAIDVVNEYKAEYDKRRRGLRLSIIATIYMFLGFPIVGGLLLGFDLALMLGGVLCIIAYIKGGGIGTAIRWACKLGVFGWIILPFPFDLITGFGLMLTAILFFFMMPVIFVYMDYRQTKKNFEAAKKYLKYYKPVQNTSQTQRVVSDSQKQYADRGYSSQSKPQTQYTNRGYQNRSQISSARNTVTPDRRVSINGTSARSNSAQTRSGRTYEVVTLPDGSKVYR